MDFKDLFTYQPDAVKMIDNGFKSGRLVQTYLFHGEQGSLKHRAALYFASLLLCENGGNCGKCRQCINIKKHNNPNLFVVSPDGDVIRKEQMEQLEREFALKSDWNRVFVIKDIDKATPSAANLLLKFLENLQPKVYGILTATNINSVLPTVRSRVLPVHFRPKAGEIIEEYLLQNGVQKDLAKALSLISTNKAEAEELANNRVLLELYGLAKAIAIAVEDEDTDIPLIFAKRGHILKQADKAMHRYFLDFLAYMQNDKIKKMTGAGKGYVFPCFAEEVELVLPLNREVRILDVILSYKEKLKYNVNLDLMYSAMAVALRKEKGL